MIVFFQDDKRPNQKHHIFKQLLPWKTKAEFVKDLKDSEVYNKGRCCNGKRFHFYMEYNLEII